MEVYMREYHMELHAERRPDGSFFISSPTHRFFSYIVHPSAYGSYGECLQIAQEFLSRNGVMVDNIKNFPSWSALKMRRKGSIIFSLDGQHTADEMYASVLPLCLLP